MGLKHYGYGAMPWVEETLASYLSPESASSLKTPTLPTKPLKTTSGLVSKAYSAAGQAAACLHTMSILQAYQADLLGEIDESGEATFESIQELRKEKDKNILMDAPLSPVGLFGDVVSSVVDRFQETRKQSAAFQRFLPRRIHPPEAAEREQPRPSASSSVHRAQQKASVATRAPPQRFWGPGRSTQAKPSRGVFGVDEEKLWIEGFSITLNSDLTEMMKDDVIQWKFGNENTLIAEINKRADRITVYDDVLDGRFRDKLKLDNQTGSLTITETRTDHAGVYQLEINSVRKRFNLTVAARLPVPVISSNSSQCSSSSSSCSLVCSAVNVSHVTLSWYKGNSLLSSISVSDLSISLSLPLEVEYQDKNTYSCVLNNPISNQTQHLDITHLCHTRSDSVHCCGPTEAVIRLVLSALVGVATVIILVYDIRSRRAERDQAHIHTSGSIEI
ncbi:SLAM family member 9-like [Megalobrama amblycephala]|uniref:SLAM family member 9-like n=1 Tax=Megalobrama amblycephala TaxID=75352 RepID=UPI0020141391|nr:SLAM family member 9-like [Megalobrama amblycephala]